ncbi:hypothetical protein Hanom_Chr01g00051471 [Helianthus anomalus]
MSVRKLSLYTPVGRKAAGEGEGDWARSIRSEFPIQIEAPIKKILRRIRDRGLISRRRPWPIHVACLTNVSDRDIVNWSAVIAINPLDQEGRLDFKGPFPVRNAAIHPKGEQPKALYPRVLPFILFLSLAGAALGTTALIALRTLIHKPRVCKTICKMIITCFIPHLHCGALNRIILGLINLHFCFVYLYILLITRSKEKITSRSR